MQKIPLAINTLDKTQHPSGCDSDELYCEINRYLITLDECERCQFHVNVEKAKPWPHRRYQVECSFTKEAPCEHEGCKEQGTFCYLYDSDEERNIYEYYCAEHTQEHGYCYMCGKFWEGSEDFDFASSGMCSNCRGEYLEGAHDDIDEYYHEPPPL